VDIDQRADRDVIALAHDPLRKKGNAEARRHERDRPFFGSGDGCHFESPAAAGRFGEAWTVFAMASFDDLRSHEITLAERRLQRERMTGWESDHILLAPERNEPFALLLHTLGDDADVARRVGVDELQVCSRVRNERRDDRERPRDVE
jgi:hypothetical protein